MLANLELLVQSIAVLLLGGWMLTGALDNLLNPRLNGEFVAMVLKLERLQELYPDLYEQFKYRRVERSSVQWLFFGAIVLTECSACLLLLLGSGLMFHAWLTVSDPALAKSIALVGTLVFVSVWAGMIVFGNWFLYWMSHEWAQNSHFQLLLWGLGTMILLLIA